MHRGEVAGVGRLGLRRRAARETAALAQARPDGYTLGFTTSTAVSLQPQLNPDLPYRPASSTPVCQTFELVFVLAVYPESPHRTAAHLASAARARPGASPDDGTAAGCVRIA